MSGILYLVATPIGNLEDITFRAINTLRNVDFIAAEDTRNTLKLLNHFEIKKKLISNYRHNEEERGEFLINNLKSGKNIAIVSDAGTPGISDPGEEIVKLAIKENIQVVPIPGACAAITALISSGLDTKEFVFYGFLPTNNKLRKRKLEELRIENKTIIIYEAPHKLNDTLKDLKPYIEDRNIVIARELTKIHEEFIRGKIDEFLEMNREWKGEMIILIEGAKIEIEENKLNELSLEDHYNFYEEQGLTKKEIIKQIARDRRVPKNEIYVRFIKK